MLAAAAQSADALGLGARLALPWAIPFVGLLLTIALAPLLAPRAWHHHYGKIAAGWSLLFAVPFVIAFRGEALHEILHILLGEYVAFVVILFGLFTVSGGIAVRGTLRGSPEFNTLLMLIGMFLASFVGTTGASMLLIRPLLRANRHRRSCVHIVVFFIFLVSNIGGALTPLGDPPLFLGFLQGVPFFWTLGRMLLPMGLTAALLLSAFYVLDRRAAKADPLPPRDNNDTGVSIGGLRNVWLLAGIIGAVLLSGFWKPGTVSVLGVDLKIAGLVRDALIVSCGLISLKITARAIRTENGFNWGPMLEVSKLFAAIFVTIVPALAILQAGEQGAMKSLVTAVETPWQFFWATGVLSSFLDNAPTYLAFFSVAIGKFSPGVDYAAAVHALTTDHAVYLAAISAGSVFMGANTYIGNAPNFMVKAIAEEGGVKMPSFFGYIFRWTLPFLIPVFLLDTLLFRLM